MRKLNILLTAIILAATAVAAYIQNLIDQIVHGQLYNYNLQFSLDWANPYWNLLRIMQILLGVIVASSVINFILTLRKSVSIKKPSEKMTPSPKPVKVATPITHTVGTESAPSSQRASPMAIAPAVTSTPPSPPQPSPQPSPQLSPAPSAPSAPSVSAPAPFSSELPGLIKCFHCGKAFTQPLRMLDFQGDRPRIISICPFCNEIIPTTPRQDEKEPEKRFLFRKKNDNHAAKTIVSQQSS